jgi:hypothetical protein
MVDDARATHKWNEALCPIPSEVLLTGLVKNGMPLPLENAQNLRDMALIGAIQAVAIWRSAKEIYRFEPEMSRLLSETTLDELTDVPSEILLRLPYPCVYIQVPDLTVHGTAYDGFFAHFDVDFQDFVGQTPRLCMILLTKDLLTGYAPMFHLTSRTIADNIGKAEAYAHEIGARIKARDATEEALIKQLSNAVDKLKNESDYEADTQCLATLLPYVLYLCASNAEITPHPEQSTIMRLPRTVDDIRDKYREVRRWDVGVRIAGAVRASADSQPIAVRGGGSSGTTKRPHMRRAHWHHYWRGPRDSERESILKWIAPTYINLPPLDDDELPAVVHPLRARKKTGTAT